jgi:hypothetical protein
MTPDTSQIGDCARGRVKAPALLERIRTAKAAEMPVKKKRKAKKTTTKKAKRGKAKK